MTFQSAESALPIEDTTVPYEAPAIESVLTTESLEREVHYAGVPPTSSPKP